MKCRNCGYEQEQDFEDYVTYIPIYGDDKHLIKFEWRSMCPECGTVKGMNCPSIVENCHDTAKEIKDACGWCNAEYTIIDDDFAQPVHPNLIKHCFHCGRELKK